MFVKRVFPLLKRRKNVSSGIGHLIQRENLQGALFPMVTIFGFKLLHQNKTPNDKLSLNTPNYSIVDFHKEMLSPNISGMVMYVYRASEVKLSSI